MAESLVTENDYDEAEAKLQYSVEDSSSGLSRIDITKTCTKASSEAHTQTEIVHVGLSSTSNSPITRMPVLGEEEQTASRTTVKATVEVDMKGGEPAADQSRTESVRDSAESVKLDRKVLKLEENMSFMEERVNKLEGTRQEDKAKQGQMEGQLSNTLVQVSEAMQEVQKTQKGMQAELKEHTLALKEVKEDVKANKQELTECKRTVSRHDDEIHSLKGKVNELSASSLPNDTCVPLSEEEPSSTDKWGQKKKKSASTQTQAVSTQNLEYYSKKQELIPNKETVVPLNLGGNNLENNGPGFKVVVSIVPERNNKMKDINEPHQQQQLKTPDSESDEESNSVPKSIPCKGRDDGKLAM